MVGIGEDTLISDRFFKGGGDPRGFEYGGIGLRDRNTNDALGGKNFYTGTVELAFPLDLPFDLDIRGRLFTYIGSARGFDETSTHIEVYTSRALTVKPGHGPPM